MNTLTKPIEKETKSKNPYSLIWYNSKMSQKQIEKNNAKYWEWEAKYSKR